jgi:hypothetical protein
MLQSGLGRTGVMAELIIAEVSRVGPVGRWISLKFRNPQLLGTSFLRNFAGNDEYTMVS